MSTPGLASRVFFIRVAGRARRYDRYDAIARPVPVLNCGNKRCGGATIAGDNAVARLQRKSSRRHHFGIGPQYANGAWHRPCKEFLTPSPTGKSIHIPVRTVLEHRP
jgi:hypothetical protein